LAELYFHQSHYVSLSFGTEPLMSKKFALFVEMLRKFSIPQTHFITNGLLLTDEIIEAAILTKLNAITISNDAATSETFRRIRGNTPKGTRIKGDGFNDIIAKLEMIRELKSQYKTIFPKVRIQFTLFDYNKEEVVPFIERYHSYFQDIYITHLSTMYINSYTDPILKRITKNEYIEIREKILNKTKKYNLSTKMTFNDLDRRKLSNKWCTFPLANRFIYHNGDLLMCDKQVYGNIFNEDLSDINRRINATFSENNLNCKIKCTQPIAKAKEI
jgi:MoaA/NifB/PqqE/SkfB family radical SAM enzyme